MKQIKVMITVPQKAVDDAIKKRIKDLEREVEQLTNRLKRIVAEVGSG